MVGSAICRHLLVQPQTQLVQRSRAQLDLRDPQQVRMFFAAERPDVVVLAAARVGGIQANSTFPAEFIRDNLQIQTTVIHEAHEAGVERLLFLGSSCIYPKHASQPMTESLLLSGPLEVTNLPYAVAKIAGITMCESYSRQYGRDYRSVMPTNLYGPGDNFHPEHSHVVPALLRRFHEAKQQGHDEVVIWGSGTPKREFLFVDDMAAACVFVLGLDKQAWQQHACPQQGFVNIGTGEDLTIAELAQLVGRVVGYQGAIGFDASKPDGTPRKLLDVSRLASMGWKSSTGLEDGLRRTYAWFLDNQASFRSV